MHHKRFSFQDEYRQFLLSYDEAYVFKDLGLRLLPFQGAETLLCGKPRVSLRLPWARRFWAFSPCISGGKTMQKNMDFEHPTFQGASILFVVGSPQGVASLAWAMCSIGPLLTSSAAAQQFKQA